MCGILKFIQNDPNHPLIHTRTKRETLKKTLPCEKVEESMKSRYINDMPRSFHSEDDGENEVQEEGLNEMLTCFFGDGNNEGDDRMDDN